MVNKNELYDQYLVWLKQTHNIAPMINIWV